MPARGFTLIELLVVMTIAAILIAAAIPSFQWFIATSRTSNAASELIATFELARSEAMRRGAIVSVCRTTDPNAAEAVLACSSVSGAGFDGNDWGSGWVMFAKTGGIDPANFEVGDTLIRRHQPLATASPRVMLLSNVAGAERVAYRRDAMPAAGAGTFSIDYQLRPGTLSDDRDPATVTLSTAGRCVVVAAGTGRILARRPTAGSC